MFRLSRHGASRISFPDEDAVEFGKTLKATLLFRDGSRLNAQATLDDRAEIREYDYAYIYYNHRGARVFQYDDAPHHPEISTHPHHLHRGVEPKRGKERVQAIDVSRVDFIAVVEKVIQSL